ncbi:MAG: DUF2784 domain-containing protein [Gammaproteobacteria bacterium]|nr:DUF2784 domain-containing protein [Gammaproteobacteria bacterium]
MLYDLLAKAVVLSHLFFILFSVLGGLLMLRWNKLIWLHIPILTWAVFIEINHWTCPLTPLENWLREQVGNAGYTGSFIEHYIIPIIYPTGLTTEIQTMLGLGILAINIPIYGWYIHRKRKYAQDDYSGNASG